MHHEPPSSDAALADALAASLEGTLGPVTVESVERMTGGASRETWAFDAVDAAGLRHRLVLRRDPPGRSSAPGSMAAEAAAMRAARLAGVVVPEVVVHHEAPSAWGGAGIVMERVAGEAVARRILRDDRFAGARGRLVAQCAAALAAVHTLDPAEVLGDGSVGDPVETLRSLLDGFAVAVPTFEWALRRLAQTRPVAAGRVVTHGDFRLGNLMVDEDGLAAVLDWELVHAGDPIEDLGWLCVRAWRFGADGDVAGLGTRDELLRAYEGAGGIAVDPEALAWWELYGTLRWGVICLAQTSAHLSGHLRSVELAAIGRRVAEVEWDLVVALEPAAARSAAARASEQSSLADPEPASGSGGLHGPPSAAELVDAVGEFLRDRVLHDDDPATAFGARVAANVTDVVARELRLGPDQQRRRTRALASLGIDSESELASLVRDGGIADDAALVGVLAEGVVDRVLVANPRYLGLSP